MLDQEAALAAKASEVERLRHEIELLSRRGEHLAASLASTKDEARALRDEAAASEHRMRGLEGQVERACADSESLRGERARLQAETHHLEVELAGARDETGSQVARAEDLQARWLDLLLRLNSIHTSASWQLSAPLRWLERRQQALVRGLRGILKAILWALTGRLARRLRVLRQARLILRSGLFDERWYVAHQPDVVLAGDFPLAHYLEHGSGRGRSIRTRSSIDGGTPPARLTSRRPGSTPWPTTCSTARPRDASQTRCSTRTGTFRATPTRRCVRDEPA